MEQGRVHTGSDVGALVSLAFDLPKSPSSKNFRGFRGFYRNVNRTKVTD